VPEQRHRLAEAHLVVQRDEADEIAVTAAAIAVEQILERVHQETGLVLEVQRAQAHIIKIIAQLRPLNPPSK